MKGEITEKFLEKLADGIMEATDLFAAFLRAGYGASYLKIGKEFEKIKSEEEKREKENELRKRFYRFSSYLKKDELVEKEGRGLSAKFKLTVKGRRKLEELKDKKRNFESLPSIDYKKTVGNEIILVAFDVAESERRKRDWLRESLKALGFQSVQQSVFVGKGKLPEQFISDLRDLNIFDSVEILEVGKLGTLKKVI